MTLAQKLSILNASLDGELLTEDKMRHIYATDASIYRELPLAVCYPKNENDILQLIHFAKQEKITLVPRAAGTSLAGQCVSDGLIVDTSKYFTQILEINENEKWVRLQPAIIRDELNKILKPHQLFFGPNTSTANRAMIGGMVGNNSSGSYSLVYGTTRNHVLEVKGFLSDGSFVTFNALDKTEFEAKLQGNTLESKLYQQIYTILQNLDNQQEIRNEFPKSSIHRRNTGYAIDELLESEIFSAGNKKFNFCEMICGSEGTLMFITEIKLHLNSLPPTENLMVCVHFSSLWEALESVTLALKYAPRAVELMDKIILDCTKENIEQAKNRFFLEGSPEAILMIEFGTNDKSETQKIADNLVAELKEKGKGYAFPYLFGADINKANELRKAGLGLLSNIPGDAKAVAVIEDTAVEVKDLSAYIREFDELMKQYNQTPVYYAHAGAGELHIRPILNLRTEEGLTNLRKIALDSAKLVKKYGGSLSGEHGDGRVRGEFIPLMIGEKNYALLKSIKETWDKDNIFNKGKITDAPAMDKYLRDRELVKIPEIKTTLSFAKEKGFLRAVEKCNGSGDCRKVSGGMMCPSYMATKNEQDTTRARANILREYLNSSYQTLDNQARLDAKAVYDTLDLCLSCKGCKSECPSNVDMAALKSEFLHQYYQKNRVPFHILLTANISRLNKIGSIFPKISNFFFTNKLFSASLKKFLYIHNERSIPLFSKITLTNWYEKNKANLHINPKNAKGKVYLFADEFTNYNESELGIQLIQVLTKLGYEVEIPTHVESGRAFISKGLLTEAKQLAEENIQLLKHLISEKTPLIGIEPSAILTFRDEYKRLVNDENIVFAEEIAKNTFTVEEFFAKEIAKGKIEFLGEIKEEIRINVHVHCHQKVLSAPEHTVKMLSLLPFAKITVIPSGCCGMAGSFGYEENHYKVSQQVGDLVLFPHIRKTSDNELIVAAGTSCRHQIADGTSRNALHPISVLFRYLLMYKDD